MADKAVHLLSLTSMRILAAALVVAFHVQSWTSTTPANDGPLRFGYVGVTFFYLLSGFVLVWTWRPGKLRWFYLRRFSRVYPLHWITALVTVALGYASIGRLPHDPAGAIVWNLSLLQAFSTDPNIAFSVNSVSWSLSNEVFFYAVFPLIMWLMSRWGRRPALLGAVSAAYLLFVGLAVWTWAPAWIGFLYYSPLYRVGEFLVGIALGAAMQDGWRVRVPLWAAFTSLVAVYGLLLLSGPAGFPILSWNLWACNIITLPVFALLIVAGASHDLRGETGVLHQKWLVQAGQWSFALFLIHEIMLRAFEPADYPVHVLSVPGGIAVGLGALALAAVLYQYVETPLDHAIRRWIKKRQAATT